MTMFQAFKKFSLLSLVIGLTTAAPISEHQKCKLLPGDRDWPSDRDWQRLNDEVHGQLIAGVPLATVCHHPNYDEVACNGLREAWQTPQAYFGHPTEVMNPTTQGLACSPYFGPNTSCLLGNMASYSINVTAPEDIKAGIRFAQRHNLRLSIKNTGHDYLGKSAGQGSLGLWMHNLKEVKVITTYTSSTYKGPAIRMGAGVQAFEAYTTAAAHKLRVVGGDCPSVGLTGGYTQGGGHGPLSSEYGIASDQVLEWEVIDSLGRHMFATPEINQDLYWALAGGGAGTFGVVVSMVVRAYPDGPVGGASLTFRRENNTETYWEMVRAFYSMTPTLVDAGSALATYFTTESWTLQVLTKASGNTSIDGISALLAPFTDALKTSGLTHTIKAITTEPSYRSHVDRYLGPLPYGIYNSSSVIAGRLVPRSVVENDIGALMNAFRFIAESGYEVNVLAQNVSRALHTDFTAPNAVLPAWRSSLFHVVVAAYWNYFRPGMYNTGVLDTLTYEIMPRLYDVTPGSGMYLNEADFQLPDGQWQTDFYGANFERLKRIKTKVDPHNTFYANRAVGAQDWEITDEGRLCPK